jgi:serine/threonine-protein kinase
MTVIADRLVAALADRYRIERELGAGGMATVYLAEDLKHRRKVALKVLKPELAAVLGAERFVQEITTTAALQHPHILPLFDSGTAEGFLYYVMPFIDGETLRRKLDRETQLGIDEAVRIASHVADALDYAHRHGVIHRDIKPENILLHDGRPMVADFGIALAVSAAAGGRMTETGLSLGTPHYMSPEQATAEKELSARSDVYSLGSVLYEMLTGSPPHTGASAQQIIMKIVTEDAAPVTRLRRAVPPNVAAAVAKSLEKLPADRFDTAKEFADALADPHFSAGTTAFAAGIPAKSRRAVTLGLSIALGVMTLVAAWALTRPSPAPPVIRYGLALPPGQAPVDGGFAVPTSDGSRIVYVGPSSQPSVWQLWVKDRDRLTATPLAGTEGATTVAISPGDDWLALVQGGVLRKVPITGGAFTTLAEGVSNVHGSSLWLDDGTILYSARNPNRIVRISDAGGSGTTLWTSDSLAASSLTAVADRGVLFQACPPPCSRTDLWALDLRTGSAVQVVGDARAGYYVATGHLVYVREDQSVLAVGFDPKAFRTKGTPVAVADSVFFGGGIFPYLSVSRSGTLVMRTGEQAEHQRFQMVWLDRTGRETPVDSTWTFRVTQTAGNYGWSISPDGTRLAIGLNTAAGDDIWIKPLPRGPAARVTYSGVSDARPRWRSDGRSVTFISDSVFAERRADGTGSDSVLRYGIFDEGLVSPDGRWMVFRMGATASTAGGRDIYGLRPGVDTAPVPLVVTPYDEMAIALSPDGRWLAYQSDETGRIEVFVRPFPNTGDAKVRVSSDGGTGPVWARDGRELFYLRGDNTMMAATVTAEPALRVGEPVPLFRLPAHLAELDAQWYTPWDIGPDGRFLMVRSAEGGRRNATPLIVVENWLEELKIKMRR